MQHRPDDRAHREEALRWLTRMHSGQCGAADREGFQRWLAQDEAHWRAYGKARRLWAHLGLLTAHDFPELAQARAYHATLNQCSAQQRTLAACLAFITFFLMVGAAAWNETISATYRTAMGELRSVSLADGSRVVLNTDSELRVVMMPQLRLLVLRRGEALFNVAHNAERPFDVHADGGTARAIGTRFSVQRREGKIQVVVEDGIVAVGNGSQAPRALLYNQAISFASFGALPAPTAVAAEDLLAWRQGKLVFTSQPLSEVLAQLQRYHAIKIRLDDPALGKLKLSGVFSTAQWQPLLSSIQATLDLQTEATSSGELVLRRSKGPHP